MFGMETWLLIVVLCGLVVILTIIGVGIFYMMKRCNKNSIGTDSTTIKPYDQDNMEMSGSNKNRAKIGDVGMAEQEAAAAEGALTMKKRKAKKKGDRNQQVRPDMAAVAQTDDEVSGMGAMNSFLGSSAQHFHPDTEPKNVADLMKIQANAQISAGETEINGLKKPPAIDVIADDTNPGAGLPNIPPQTKDPSKL